MASFGVVALCLHVCLHVFACTYDWHDWHHFCAEENKWHHLEWWLACVLLIDARLRSGRLISFQPQHSFLPKLQHINIFNSKIAIYKIFIFKIASHKHFHF